MGEQRIGRALTKRVPAGGVVEAPVERKQAPVLNGESLVTAARETRKNASASTVHHAGTHKAGLELHAGFDAEGRGAKAALEALRAAGIGPELAGTGPDRSTGLGITVPLMAPRPSFDLEAYAATPLPAERVRGLRIAIAADHGAYGRAEETAAVLRRLGAVEVTVFAPVAPERRDYGVTTAHVMSMLERGEADRVIAFCGNGLGALDVANVFAELGPEGKKTRPPVYGDNFWTIADSQRGEPPANVLCLGARLLNVDGDPLAAYVKAFLDDPAHIDTLGTGGPARHGVSSTLIDPKPGRIEARTLKPGYPFAGATVAEQAVLDFEQLKRIARLDARILYDASSPLVKAQVDALERLLPKTVELIPWDGRTLPEGGPRSRMLLLTEDGSTHADPRAYGFFRPEHMPPPRVQRAEHWRQVESFARDTPPGPLYLDVPCRAVTDTACGGAGLDLLAFLTKTFLVTPPGDALAHKPLYGDAIQYAIGELQRSSTESR